MEFITIMVQDSKSRKVTFYQLAFSRSVEINFRIPQLASTLKSAHLVDVHIATVWGMIGFVAADLGSNAGEMMTMKMKSHSPAA